jgi:dihydropteroate synthase
MATVAEIQAELTAFKAARTQILEGAQMYKIGGRSLTRGDLAEINKEIRRLEMRLSVAQNSNQVTATSVVFGGHRG